MLIHMCHFFMSSKQIRKHVVAWIWLCEPPFGVLGKNMFQILENATVKVSKFQIWNFSSFNFVRSKKLIVSLEFSH